MRRDHEARDRWMAAGAVGLGVLTIAALMCTLILGEFYAG